MSDKKQKLAIALKYEEEENAPKVIAKGKGIVAEKIIEEATEVGIKTFEEKNLSKELYKIDIGNEIPEELYTSVAKILAFIYELDNKKEI